MEQAVRVVGFLPANRISEDHFTHLGLEMAELIRVRAHRTGTLITR